MHLRTCGRRDRERQAPAKLANCSDVRQPRRNTIILFSLCERSLHESHFAVNPSVFAPLLLKTIGLGIWI
jgi:hypothetical protein